ncbi:hypothetical protein Taro_012625 [Colocasia esculenta]|uniref:Uncharacterized protein n=1 Tax=Colocasia esculenta TaxID=4460 RepID=A0A843UJR3_COLES|nr:hypothetical protein [Colocasia esculenta]
MRAVAADRAGNDGLEGGVRWKLLGGHFVCSGGFCSEDLGVNIVGPFIRDCEAERLFLCCVVRVGYWPDQPVDRSRVVASFFATRALLAPVVVVSRFDSFEVCPGVGTVVTAIVACGVPEWWHSFSYRWYLYPVWVMVCGGTSYTSLSGVDVELCFVEVVWCDLPHNVLHPPSVLFRAFRVFGLQRHCVRLVPPAVV